ncbi:MAG TPA: DnaJ domain-containing protein [Clostridiales bacterium]|nr:DnaJ domain-containing protein [Clostridiales bacterium]
MSDPYKVLGVSPTATDEEIKSAYRELAKKYHPDNYSGSPIADLASEKMKEINEAYDAIVSERKQRRHSAASNQNTAPYGGGYTGYSANTGSYGGYYGSGSGFSDVRNLIMSGRIADAEQILNGVPAENRNAEWHFLKGTVLYKRGWLEEAYNNFARACQMDPGNPEYRAALNQVNSQRSGVYGGYNPAMPRTGGCSSCDICSSLICADCCCESMGGDLIPCC